MTTLIFATNNQNKVKEIRAVLQNGFEIITLKEAGIDIDIPEPHDTLSANATEKSTVIHRLTGKNCFSEDTGLEVAALNGEPGVRSARYAGEDNNFQHNVLKLLANMENTEDRSAQFRTVISLILDDKEYQFEGICKGHITRHQQGAGGFGYDPVFIPEGSDRTFAEMTMEEKNIFSHRKKATAQLIQFLNAQYGKDKS
ncbi:RdgB/HAM1 family non-canonical purine NTP pyrophosphatase [Ferruginibacter sp. HRS2-29]|uniref:RdgB/HAM1 family non-canonical purine NTP pyrophosphatase n=1 Tax=Ferruginibacter sp. HRS2-29 TaxID=2487334 RepID=UPI0020CC7BBF|nr:RdgB/HAM1 family non-canonical purine NTP pyrophosphatase [Ferruginibacter sp. HRS2-29]MCP9753323.1 RdgB/HAM1 family non-canonical purine NTP pyrophosphatase [Ferruginibacter sp. HRS2-29]